MTDCESSQKAGSPRYLLHIKKVYIVGQRMQESRVLSSLPFSSIPLHAAYFDLKWALSTLLSHDLHLFTENAVCCALLNLKTVLSVFKKRSCAA